MTMHLFRHHAKNFCHFAVEVSEALTLTTAALLLTIYFFQFTLELHEVLQRFCVVPFPDVFVLFRVFFHKINIFHAALCPPHIRSLRRHCPEVTFCRDRQSKKRKAILHCKNRQ